LTSNLLPFENFENVSGIRLTGFRMPLCSQHLNKGLVWFSRSLIYGSEKQNPISELVFTSLWKFIRTQIFSPIFEKHLEHSNTVTIWIQ
jgi:hypothetical protein